MKRKIGAFVATALMIAGLTACQATTTEPAPEASSQPAASQDSSATKDNAADSAAATQRTIHYLDKDYTFPAKAERMIMAGSLESMEDALVLGVKPTGATTVGGEFPSLFAPIMDGVEKVGEKMQPNIEAMLNLKPDLILASTKFPPESIEKFNKVTTTIPVSHIATDWEANLNLLAELTGTQDKAKQALENYKATSKTVREKVEPVFKDKKVLLLRVRTGKLFIYPEDVFFNPSLYAELGAAVPAEVKQAKAQQNISLEKLAEMNPDYLFVQLAESENKETPNIFKDLQNNPVWKSINAVKNDNMFLNLVDPITQGGTAYSKIAFMDAIKNSKLMQGK